MTVVPTAPGATFSVWLEAHADDDDAVGDLARDVAADVASGCAQAPAFPDGLRAHLEAEHAGSRDAVFEVLSAAAEQWRRDTAP